MRVITGTAKGRRLETLEGEDVRPTTERIKEAVFSIIQFEIMGHTFLDLFAGSGQMGIEAISRGASSAYFVDASKKSLDVVKKNISSVKFDKEAKVFAMDYRSFLSMNTVEFDIAFLDPPYKKVFCRTHFRLWQRICGIRELLLQKIPLTNKFRQITAILYLTGNIAMVK